MAIIRAGSVANPLAVGGHWQIVNVGWGGPNIGVLTFEFAKAFTRGYPVVTLSDMIVGSSFNIFTEQVKIGGAATVVNPISDEMRRELYVWNAVPEKEGPNDDEISTGKALIFFNLGKLIAKVRQTDDTATSLLLGKITTPAGTIETHEDPAYWLWDDTFGATSLEENLANPFTTGDPLVGPSAVMTVPRAFEDSASRDAYLALGVTSWHGANTIETTQGNNEVAWETTLTSWSRKKNFPVVSTEESSTLTTAGETATPPERKRDSAADHAAQDGASLAAVTLRYTLIFKDLKVRIDRV